MAEREIIDRDICQRCWGEGDEPYSFDGRRCIECNGRGERVLFTGDAEIRDEEDGPFTEEDEAEKPDGGVDGQDSREPEADYWDSLFGEDFAADKEEPGRAAADSESDAGADCGVE